MSLEVVQVGLYLVNLARVSAMHWEDGKGLFVHFDGGRFLQLDGPKAQRLWEAYAARALNLDTGEAPKAE